MFTNDRKSLVVIINSYCVEMSSDVVKGDKFYLLENLSLIEMISRSEIVI